MPEKVARWLFPQCAASSSVGADKPIVTGHAESVGRSTANFGPGEVTYYTDVKDANKGDGYAQSHLLQNCGHCMVRREVWKIG